MIEKRVISRLWEWAWKGGDYLLSLGPGWFLRSFIRHPSSIHEDCSGEADRGGAVCPLLITGEAPLNAF
jgi:hypothetical protein